MFDPFFNRVLDRRVWPRRRIVQIHVGGVGPGRVAQGLPPLFFWIVHLDGLLLGPKGQLAVGDKFRRGLRQGRR